MRHVVCLFVCLFACAAVSEAATRTVCASGCQYANLQTAINEAVPGDTILLRAGQTYVGNYTLKRKSGSSTAFITIKSDAPASSLPGRGRATGAARKAGWQHRTQRACAARRTGRHLQVIARCPHRSRARITTGSNSSRSTAPRTRATGPSSRSATTTARRRQRRRPRTRSCSTASGSMDILQGHQARRRRERPLHRRVQQLHRRHLRARRLAGDRKFQRARAGPDHQQLPRSGRREHHVRRRRPARSRTSCRATSRSAAIISFKDPAVEERGARNAGKTLGRAHGPAALWPREHTTSRSSR